MSHDSFKSYLEHLQSRFKACDTIAPTRLFNVAFFACNILDVLIIGGLTMTLLSGAPSMVPRLQVGVLSGFVYSEFICFQNQITETGKTFISAFLVLLFGILSILWPRFASASCLSLSLTLCYFMLLPYFGFSYIRNFICAGFCAVLSFLLGFFYKKHVFRLAGSFIGSVLIFAAWDIYFNYQMLEFIASSFSNNQIENKHYLKHMLLTLGLPILISAFNSLLYWKCSPFRKSMSDFSTVERNK